MSTMKKCKKIVPHSKEDHLIPPGISAAAWRDFCDKSCAKDMTMYEWFKYGVARVQEDEKGEYFVNKDLKL